MPPARPAILFQCGAGAVGAFAVILQYGISVLGAPGFLRANLAYFSFFTILSNILAAATLLAVAAPASPARRFLTAPGTRTAVAVYMCVVGLVFFIVLRPILHLTGVSAFTNVLLHYLMPPLYVLAWLLFVPKRGLRFAQLPLWQLFPLVYCLWVLVRGAIIGRYPYPFLDAASYGYRQISLNILVLALLFTAISAGFIAVAKLATRITRDPTGVRP